MSVFYYMKPICYRGSYYQSSFCLIAYPPPWARGIIIYDLISRGHLTHRPTGGGVSPISWVKCLPKVIFLGKIFVKNDIFGSCKNI